MSFRLRRRSLVRTLLRSLARSSCCAECRSELARANVVSRSRDSVVASSSLLLLVVAERARFPVDHATTLSFSGRATQTSGRSWRKWPRAERVDDVIEFATRFSRGFLFPVTMTSARGRLG